MLLTRKTGKKSGRFTPAKHCYSGNQGAQQILL